MTRKFIMSNPTFARSITGIKKDFAEIIAVGNLLMGINLTNGAGDIKDLNPLPCYHRWYY